jgi:hypothetical protein
MRIYISKLCDCISQVVGGGGIGEVGKNWFLLTGKIKNHKTGDIICHYILLFTSYIFIEGKLSMLQVPMARYAGKSKISGHFHTWTLT